MVYGHGSMVRLTGQVGLVTGGGRGIGAAVAGELARAGMQIAVTGRTRAQVEAVAEEIGGLGLVGDVSRQSDVDAWVSETERRLGPIDLLVNNAGDRGRARAVLGAPSVRVVAGVRGECVRRVSVLPRRRRGDGEAPAGSDRECHQRRRCIPEGVGRERHELPAEQGCFDSFHRAVGRTARRIRRTRVRGRARAHPLRHDGESSGHDSMDAARCTTSAHPRPRRGAERTRSRAATSTPSTTPTLMRSPPAPTKSASATSTPSGYNGRPIPIALTQPQPELSPQSRQV